MMTTNRRIPLIAGAAAVLLAVVWYFVLWSPQAKDLKAAHKAEAAAQAKVSNLQSEQVSLQGLLKQIPADNAKYAVLQAALPDSPELDQALSLIHQAAVATGATVTSISPTAPAGAAGGQQQSTAQSGGPSVTLSIAVKGTFEQIKTFLTALNQLPRTVVIDHVSLNNSGVSSAGSVTARIFYAGQPTP